MHSHCGLTLDDSAIDSKLPEQLNLITAMTVYSLNYKT